MSGFESNKSQLVLFRVALGLGAASMTIAVGLFAYLGTFTRYLADDYCEAVAARNGLIQSLIQRYQTVSDRYSNLLFTGLLEFLNPALDSVRSAHYDCPLGGCFDLARP